MPWTTQQTKAICEKEKNLLVSAAAGSGKTAVLVERIIRLILEEQTDIDRFLVVTFTKAAASEMKEKLTRAIREQIRVEEDKDKRAFLRRQESRMYMANISTFHSFAIGVVRRFFQYADVDPSVRVIDEGEADILLWDAMEEAVSSMFDEEDPAFRRFLDRHSRNGGEDSLGRSLLADYHRLRSIPHYFDWLDQSLARLSEPMPEALGEEALEWMRGVYLTELEKAEHTFRELYDLLLDHGVGTLAEQVEPALKAVSEMIRICRTQDDFRHCISALPSVSLAQTLMKGKEKAAEKEAYQQIKDQAPGMLRAAKKSISELQKVYTRHTDQEEQQMMRQTAEDGAVYREILHRMESLYQDEKHQRRVIDYADIEHYAIDILQHDDAAAIYRSQFEYIFIDEYQDSNYLQETIIGAVARPDNLFMVGDVKQSIYRFRMAEPDIFLEKYRRFAVSDGADMTIDLNDNFRSKRGVISAVNHVFRTIMEGYDDNAALHQGAPDSRDIDYPADLYLLDRTEEVKDENGDVDEELSSMKWQEKEAMMICGLIRNMLGQPFYDTKTGTVRDFQLKDMVILMRSTKQAGPVFKDVFRREGIGLFVADTSSFFETIEIQTFLDLLQLLDNPQRDLALLGVLRSFFFGFSIDELIRIRMHDKSRPFYETFAAYSKEGENTALRDKCGEASAAIDQWRRQASYLPLDELIGRLLHDTGYYAYMGAVPGGQQRQANLRTLADKTRGLMDMGRTHIQDLLRYVASLQTRGKVDVGQTSILGENDDVVRMMTIHKSKGLEFPLVFVSGLGAGKGKGSSDSFAAIDRGMGIAIQYIDTDRRYREDLLLKTLISEKQKKQEQEEDIRVLYVAMTRARDKLILTAAVDSEKTSSSYYYNMLQPALEQENCPIRIRHSTLPAGSLKPVAAGPAVTIGELLSGYLQHRDEHIRCAVDHLLSAGYPFEDDLSAKSKYSVTELNKHEEQAAPVIRLPRFLSYENESASAHTEISGAALGTILHTAMEHLPFTDLLKTAADNPDRLKEQINTYLDSLAGEEILTGTERDAVDPVMIEQFLTGELGDRIRHAETVSRETPFTCTVQKDGREVLVQGSIDCWFVEDGQIVLLDYKSNMKTDQIQALYQAQIDLYRQALEQLTGMPVKEAYLYLLREGRLVRM